MKSEQMDQPDVDRNDLSETLYDLAFLNKYLGAQDINRRFLCPEIKRICGEQAEILDVGTGLADGPVQMIQWASKRKMIWRITATDVSPLAVAIASDFADAQLDPSVRKLLTNQTADLRHLPFDDRSFDVVTANQVLHHFDDDEIPSLLTELLRVSRRGIFVQDLHRHIIPLGFIAAFSKAMRLAEMVQNDGPISVRKGFTRDGILKYFETAGLPRPRITWHPTFRYMISTLRD